MNEEVWPSRDPLVVLGIDPGTRVMGYGVVARKRGRLVPVDFGAVRTKRGDSLTERLVTLRDFLVRVMDHHRPDVIALEQVFVAKNVQSALRVGEARAIVLLCAGDRKLPVLEYPTAVAKRAVAGHGGASKGAVQSMVREQLSLDVIPEPHDAADALALAICLLTDPRLNPRFPADLRHTGRYLRGEGAEV
jgi:crossover junction endodeoxyribonuclease RuvC